MKTNPKVKKFMIESSIIIFLLLAAYILSLVFGINSFVNPLGFIIGMTAMLFMTVAAAMLWLYVIDWKRHKYPLIIGGSINISGWIIALTAINLTLDNAVNPSEHLYYNIFYTYMLSLIMTVLICGYCIYRDKVNYRRNLTAHSLKIIEEKFKEDSSAKDNCDSIQSSKEKDTTEDF